MPDPADATPAAEPATSGATAPRSSTSRWVIYSVVRVVMFVGVFVLLWALGMDLWLAGIATAIITLCISYIFIPQPKRAPRVEKPDVDAEVEDAVIADAAPLSPGDDPQFGGQPAVEQPPAPASGNASDATRENEPTPSEGDRSGER
ncbi:hypothetical protein [Ruicaihuangia caeni]|uniref:DUF4229 domain-containing protein n=1 Tax=Ruicaihuangia caeni TaxID=3042517 RepID=A0AAW6T972_9MICO|nr:hypothetical protein [Klugiella sp. YN-L-19]MDI2098899.1 hypothetical protein [Klugiella sp. YN-L-19]